LQLGTVLNGLRAAISKGKTSVVNRDDADSISQGANGLGQLIEVPGATGKDEWAVLCVDIATLVLDSGTHRGFYCPNAAPIFAKNLRQAGSSA
jgi:hypothetical protein